ncbi:YwiC-like protein [Parageobacillus thermantarcticus]|uniref:YwiC-like protein n=1 Tax=Parageobacillus thermantarcticus TaxID=186116 RepID=A0A1I0SUG3_9BACL|nr:YwiC-like family protein [Parageobacillus thermantarcticus]SFA43160.1 YwiC-like protein [Parageobacillus thermantarcticus]
MENRQKQKWIVPKQHGAWAMLVIPFLLGAYAGGFTWLHLPLFLGWLFLYLATYPLLMSIKSKRKQEYKKSFSFYIAIAAAMLVICLWYAPSLFYFGMAMIPLFLINIYYTKRKQERAFWNDVAAIAAFCIGGLASFYIGRGTLTVQALEIAAFCFLFFLGSTFYVKTMIREKKNPMYKWLSWGYHGLLMIALVVIGYPLLVLAYVPSVVRAVYLYGKSLPIMKIGILEFANAIYFLVAMVVLYS